MSGHVVDIAVYPIDNVTGVSNPASIYAILSARPSGDSVRHR